MNKNKKWIIPAAAVVVIIAAAAVCIPAFLKNQKTNELIQQQNYVAARLLTLGSYEEGRTLASQTDQLSANMTSRELIVLADGLQESYEYGLERAQGYLTDAESTVLSTLVSLYENFLEEAGVLDNQLEEDELDEYSYETELSELKSDLKRELLLLVQEVENSIDAKVDSASVQAILAFFQSGSSSLSSEDLTALEEDDSLLASSVSTSVSVSQGDYESAFNSAQEVLEATGSFESRAALANISASYSTYLAEDEELNALSDKCSKLYSELYELQYESYDSDEVKQQAKLEAQIEELEAEIAQLEARMDLLPVQKAINYIETTASLKDRAGSSYKMELAQLYYLSGDEDTAQEYLAEILIDNEGTDQIDDLINDFVTAYEVQNDKKEGTQYSEYETDTEDTWNRIATLLGFTDSYDSIYGTYYYDSSYNTGEDGSFYDFVTSFLYDALFGISIRSIDATGFPTIRMAVNVSVETSQTLTESDFSIWEMGTEISDFTILNQDELEDNGDYSIVLVVDKSGSMGDDGMDDTREAVSTFVRNAGASSIGLVAFDDDAQTITELTATHSAVLRGVETLSSGGGTSIYRGLEEAADLLRGASGTKIIVLMSDGMDSSTDMIDSVLKDINRQGITVYTIGVGNGVDADYLSSIATSCGGRYLQAESTAELTEIYLQIGSYMTNDYVIEFTVETDLEDFSRYVRAGVNVVYGTAEKEYDVGVPYEDILSEDGQTPMTDFINQVGGSYR